MLLVFAALVFTAVECKRTSDKQARLIQVEVEDGSDFHHRAFDRRYTAELVPQESQGSMQPAGDETRRSKEETGSPSTKRTAESEDCKKSIEGSSRKKMMENIAKTYKSYFDTGTAAKLTEDDFKLQLLRSWTAQGTQGDGESTVQAHPESRTRLYPKHMVAYWE